MGQNILVGNVNTVSGGSSQQSVMISQINFINNLLHLAYMDDREFREEFTKRLKQDFARHFLTPLYISKMKFFDVSDSSDIKRIQEGLENLNIDVFKKDVYINPTCFLNYCNKSKDVWEFTGFFLESPLEFRVKKPKEKGGEEIIEYGKANVDFVPIKIDFTTGDLTIESVHFSPRSIGGPLLFSNTGLVVYKKYLDKALSSADQIFFSGYLDKAVKHVCIKVMRQSIS